MKLNESTNKYKIKDVVYVNPQKFLYPSSQKLAKHPFAIMTIKDGKYYGAMLSTKGFVNNKDSYEITTNEFIGNLRSGRIKLDNVAYFEDKDILNKAGELTQDFYDKIKIQYLLHIQPNYFVTQYIESFNKILDMYEKFDKIKSLKEYLKFYESKGDSKMTKYKIDFEYDLEPIEEENDEGMYQINYVDVDKFEDSFDNKEKIENFNDWYNSNFTEDDEEYIKIENIDLEVGDEGGYLIITINRELNEEEQEELKSDTLFYLFDDYDNAPTFNVNFTGKAYRDVWNYTRDEPDQAPYNYDYDKTFKIHNFINAKISKVD